MIKKSILLMIAVMAVSVYLPANASVLGQQREHMYVTPHHLFSPLQGVSGQVTTSITQPNVKVVGVPPATALSNLYEQEGNKLDLLQKQDIVPTKPLLPKQHISSNIHIHP